MSRPPDPFGTAALRQSVLQAWAASPTRFREDANAEEDLRLGGYRDRLLVELAQNAADAAGTGGVLRIDLHGPELRIANTGAPLTAEGVASLASLRASAKRDSTAVGRFGVGFAAVLSVCDEPRIASTTGGVSFSAHRTRDEAARLPGPAEELAARAGVVPALRLVWPSEERPPSGFDTEVRLPLRADGTDGGRLLAEFAEQAADVLLALPALAEIRVGSHAWRRHERGEDRIAVHGPQGSVRWLVHRSSGPLPADLLADLGAEARDAGWRTCWAVPLGENDVPIPLAQDVLHVPTVTEERLSLPARLLASVPVEPDRRRVTSSAATEAVLARAAETYPDLVLKVPPEHRSALVPLPGFPLSDVDDQLRRAINDRLRGTPWLPAAAGGAVAPHEARVLDSVSGELVELLSDVVPGLLATDLSDSRHRRALNALEIRRLGAADVVEAVTGLERPARWWYRLYEALSPLERSDARAREEFTALPVPLADGRTVTGVREVFLVGEDPGPAAFLATLEISGLRIADPEAAHPLLERLGAGRAGPDELLDSPALAAAVRGSLADARAGADVLPLAEAVLSLVRAAGTREWLGALALPDADGDVRRSDELLLPDAALRDVLATEHIGGAGPLAVLDSDLAERWPADLLRAVGVLDGFAVHVEEEPLGPPEDFPDADQWWAEREATRSGPWPPTHFIGIRDLDLVAEDAWPRAIRLLASDPDTLRALRERDGYARWWLARFARLGGHAPRYWRLPGAEEITGLYDPPPDVGLDLDDLTLAGVRAELRIVDTDDAEDLLGRLGDPERAVRAGTALRAHGVLAEAVACGKLDPADLGPPDNVRSISGAVVTTARAVVLDEPWMLGVLDAPLVVAGGSPEQFDAEALAELLDLPLASEERPLRVAGEGAAQRWSDVARVTHACELLAVPMPSEEVVVHEQLRVRTDTETHRVHWWVDTAGGVHAERTPDGLARALAWAAGSWPDRFALAALLADPQAATLLR